MHKSAGALLATILSFLVSVPPDLARLATVALWFLVADTCGGLWLARRTGSISSSVYRTKLKDKLVMYSLILALCFGIGLIAQAWAWPVAGFGAVVAGEALSLGETLRGGLKLSGAAWTKPVATLLDRSLGLFQKGEGEGDGDSKPDAKTEDAATASASTESA